MTYGRDGETVSETWVQSPAAPSCHIISNLFQFRCLSIILIHVDATFQDIFRSALFKSNDEDFILEGCLPRSPMNTFTTERCSNSKYDEKVK